MDDSTRFFIERSTQPFTHDTMVSIRRHDGGRGKLLAVSIGGNGAEAMGVAAGLVKMLTRKEIMKARMEEIDCGVWDM